MRWTAGSRPSLPPGSSPARFEGVSLVALGCRELARQGLLRGMDWSVAGLAAPHPGLWRFVWTANLYTSLSAASGHLITLLVGWLLGPTAAGLFKIASQFASVLVVPGTLLKRTIYPELAKLTARGRCAGDAPGDAARRRGFREAPPRSPSWCSRYSANR